MFHYSDSVDSAYPSSPADRYQINLNGILIAHQLEQEQRLATPEEQAILAGYSGWGDTQVRKRGFDWYGEPNDPRLAAVLTTEEKRAISKSTLNAHYTGLDVVRLLWAMVERLVGHGPPSPLWILEPSCGAGAFFGTLPTSLSGSHLVGVELDKTTVKIAQALYPEVDIKPTGLEQANLPANQFDVIIGNVPFGNYGVTDPSIKFNFLKSSIHDYFIAKSITLLKPNGHAILITSRYTLDKKDSSTREWLAKHADLLAAFRLPETAFQESAGTDVVVDILVLRKRTEPRANLDGVDWIGTVEKSAKAGDVTLGKANVSTYYDLHPEHLLGSYAKGKMQMGFSFTVKPLQHGTLTEQLTKAMECLQPCATLAPSTAPSPTSTATLTSACELAQRVYQRGKELLQVQASGSPDTQTQRRRLNLAYDSYRARFGTFASALASSAKHNHPLELIKGEGWFAFLLALEDKQGNKSKLFTENTVAGIPAQQANLPIADAMHVCLDQHGVIDTAKVASLAGVSVDIAIAGLAQDNLAFRLPGHTDQWVPAAEYLSGNVREKLATAKAAAVLNSSYERNVTCLTQAQPAPLGSTEIRASFGATWIPPEVYIAFIKNLFPGTNWGVKVSFLEPTASWIVEITNPSTLASKENTVIYGTSRMDAASILREAINLKIPVIYDEYEKEDGSTGRVKNEKETAAAQGKLLEIKARWDSWIWADDTRTQLLCDTYNDRFNGFRLRQFDGGYLSFPGLALEVEGKPYQLRKHQRNGVARILSQGTYDNSAFPVYAPGFGKTDTGICGIVKATQLGLVTRTCFVVPKHTLGQWRERFLALYPGLGDELLASQDDSFTPLNRRKFLSQIVSGGYKYVLMTYEQFRTIPLSQETFSKYLASEVESLRDYLNDTIAKSVEAKALSREFKKREKSLAKFETKYQARWEKMTINGEAPITWEECGFTAICIDECQMVKRDVVFTKMENVAGLPRGESQRAFDTRVKVHYILGKGGKAVALTGTPLTNTLAEIWIWMRCYQPKLLKHLGLWHFDAWAATFTEPFSSIEMDAVGNFRMQTRLRYQNIPEILLHLAECWDRAPDAPEVKRPQIVGGQPRVIEVAGSEALVAYTEELAERADLVRHRKVDPKDDNMLVITSHGKWASLFNGDPKLGFVEGVRTKVDALTEEVWRYYCESYKQHGTQIIFCDMYTPKEKDSGEWVRRSVNEDEEQELQQEDMLTDNEKHATLGVYGVIKQKLVNAGILPHEIEFAHDVSTDSERLAQHDRMRRGRCRVLIGSTGKMGTGVNVQDQVYALHHLDCPWRPDELEQRTARAVRDGNIWPAVHVLVYVTQRSYDPVVWQLIEYKAKIVAQIMSGKLTSRTAEDIGNLVLTAGMAKAIAMGDSRVVDKIRLETELTNLERQWKAWYDTHNQLRFESRRLPALIEDERCAIDSHLATKEILAKHKGEFNCSLREIGGGTSGQMTFVTLPTAQEASEHIRRLTNLLGKTIRNKSVLVGLLNGVSLYFELWHGTLTLAAYPGKAEGAAYRVTGLGFQNARSIEQMLAELNNIDGLIRRSENQIQLHQSRALTADREASKPWGSEARAKELLERYKALCSDLAKGGMIDECSWGFRFVEGVNKLN